MSGIIPLGPLSLEIADWDAFFPGVIGPMDPIESAEPISAPDFGAWLPPLPEGAPPKGAPVLPIPSGARDIGMAEPRPGAIPGLIDLVGALPGGGDPGAFAVAPPAMGEGGVDSPGPKEALAIASATLGAASLIPDNLIPANLIPANLIPVPGRPPPSDGDLSGAVPEPLAPSSPEPGTWQPFALRWNAADGLLTLRFAGGEAQTLTAECALALFQGGFGTLAPNDAGDFSAATAWATATIWTGGESILIA